MEYWLITTTDDKGNKALGGGIMKRQGSQQPIINHIDVKSVDQYLSKVKQLGGKVQLPKTAVPGMDYFAICLDTENNAFGICETNENEVNNQFFILFLNPLVMMMGTYLSQSKIMIEYSKTKL